MDGELLISPVAHEDALKKMGIITDRVINVGGFAEPQREFLEFHRTNVVLKRESNTWTGAETGALRLADLSIPCFCPRKQERRLFSILSFCENNEVYDSLSGVSERGAWSDWIEYFLLGVARMSEDALSQASRINGKPIEWQKTVAGDSTNAPLRVVELLAANPFITAKGAAKKLSFAFTTAQRAIERLDRLGIVKQVGDAKRDRVYCAKALLDILEEPARLTPAGH